MVAHLRLILSTYLLTILTYEKVYLRKLVLYIFPQVDQSNKAEYSKLIAQTEAMVGRQARKLCGDGKLRRNCGDEVFRRRFRLTVYFTFSAGNLITCRCKRV